MNTDNEQNEFNLTTENLNEQIDWTLAWSKKYPILIKYQSIKGIESYKNKINKLYDEFKDEFKLNDTDTILILKDILYHTYLEKK